MGTLHSIALLDHVSCEKQKSKTLVFLSKGLIISFDLLINEDFAAVTKTKQNIKNYELSYNIIQTTLIYFN